MKSEDFNFKDAMTGRPVYIIVQSEIVLDPEDSRGFSNSVFVGLESDDGMAAAEAYVPRKQVKKLITALLEALNEK